MVNIVLLEPLSINRRAGWLRTIVRVDTVSPRKVSRTRGRCLPRNGDAGPLRLKPAAACSGSVRGFGLL